MINENVHEVSSLNGRLSKAISKSHANDRVNTLYTLLSDKKFYDAAHKLSDLLGTRKLGNMNEEAFIDSFLVNQVIQLGLADVSTENDTFSKEHKARKWFSAQLQELLNKHHIPAKYSGLINEYIILGSVNYLSYNSNLVVSYNDKNKSLVLTLSPELTLTDFKEKLPAIFKYWDSKRVKASKPKHFNAITNSELARDKDSMSYGELVKKYALDEAIIKKRVQRIKDRRASLLSDTN